MLLGCVQIEGAFMQGVGYVMTEEVVEDDATGDTISNSTWTYKPPGIAELPRVSVACGFSVADAPGACTAMVPTAPSNTPRTCIALQMAAASCYVGSSLDGPSSMLAACHHVCSRTAQQ